MKNSLLIIWIILLNGCFSNQHYIGKVTDCHGTPIRNIEVNAWKNQHIPFHLPKKINTTRTDSEGSFKIVTKKRVGFFTYSGMILLVDNHPHKSGNKCNE